MEAISGENANEYYKVMDDEIKSIMRRDMWYIVPSKSVADHNVILGTWSLKYNSNPDWTISKLEAQYCTREDVHKRLPTEPLN